jgi:D-alanine-D-alanine ligase
VLGEGDEAVALPVIEIRPKVAYDFESKYLTDSTEYLIGHLAPEMEAEIQQLVLRAYKSLGCRTWGRADVMLREGKPYLLEMNTSPGMTSHSLVPMSAKAAGISYEQLCLWLVSRARADA